jgi:hypothetical protein
VPAVKLDENVPDSVGAILRDAGHDVALARDQQLAGAADDHILAVATGEARVLVTLDRDFTNISAPAKPRCWNRGVPSAESDLATDSPIGRGARDSFEQGVGGTTSVDLR